MKRKIPDWAIRESCVMPFDEFYEYVEDGGIMDYDGVGYFSDGEYEYDDVPLYCTTEYLLLYKSLFSHVVWYNK